MRRNLLPEVGEEMRDLNFCSIEALSHSTDDGSNCCLLTSEKLNLLIESMILWQCALYMVSSVCSLSGGMEEARSKSRNEGNSGSVWTAVKVEAANEADADGGRAGGGGG